MRNKALLAVAFTLLTTILLAFAGDIDGSKDLDLFKLKLGIQRSIAPIGAANMAYYDNGQCAINIPEDPLKSIMDYPDSSELRPYLEQIVIGHEKSHCIFFSDNLNVVKLVSLRGEALTGDPQSFSSLLSESFSDAYAVMAMLKKYGFSPESITAAKLWHKYRKDSRLELIVYMDDVHFTDFTMDILLSNLNQVKDIDSVQGLKSLSMEWAMTGALRHAKRSRYGFGINEYGRIKHITNDRYDSILELQCQGIIPAGYH